MKARVLTPGWKITDKQGEEVRTILVVMDWSWRHQYELMFRLIETQMDIIYIHVYRYRLYILWIMNYP